MSTETLDGRTLQDLFPGQTIVLSNGRTVTIRPWSAEKVVREVPARIAGIVATLTPALAGAGGDRTRLLERLQVAIPASIGSIAGFLLDEAGLAEEELRTLRPADLVRIARGIIEQNLDFFVEIEVLRALVADKKLTGLESPMS